MIAALSALFIVALAAPHLHRRAPRVAVWVIPAVPTAVSVWLVSLSRSAIGGVPHRESYAWFPLLDVRLSFMADGLSLLFGVLITAIGVLVLVYTGRYMAGHPRQGSLYGLLLLFMGSMLGLVLAENLLLLFVFWELTSVSSYLLVGFDRERDTARSAALQALVVTGLGGLALLAGLLLLGMTAGSFELGDVLRRGDAIRESALYAPIVVLVVVAAATKSAQVPFHFWLPNAMEAPTPVSAYLHSSTMVKAGIYLLARLHPIAGGSELWTALLTAMGAATLLAGGVLALREEHLKRVLAYSTVSALGLLTLLLGIGTQAAIVAAVGFLVAHALYKAALFLAAGVMIHEAQETSVAKLSGVWKAAPASAIAAAAAAASMAGLPPALGFVSKELTFEASLGWAGFPLLAAVLGGSALFVAIAAVVGLAAFGRPLSEGRGGRSSPALWAGSLALAGAGLLLGLRPSGIEPLLSAAATSIAGADVPVHLSLWHGFTPALGLSGVALAGGLAVYGARWPLRRVLGASGWLGRGPGDAYDGAMAGLFRLARWQTGVLQGGSLGTSLLIVVATGITFIGAALLRGGSAGAVAPTVDPRFHEAALALLILAAAVAAVRARSRLGAVAAVGVVGYGVALIFVLFGAPDLAMTQFVIETLLVILLVFAFYHLPSFSTFSTAMERRRDVVAAVAIGALVSVLVLLVTAVEAPGTISGYFVERSVPEAHGRNVVNVILVDFRAIDTLGEIAVLALGGLGVYGLLKLRPAPEGGRP